MCEDFMFDGKIAALAIGKTGCDFSTDNGRSWKHNSSIEGYFTFMAIPGKPTGFVAGAKGKISKMSFRD